MTSKKIKDYDLDSRFTAKLLLDSTAAGLKWSGMMVIFTLLQTLYRLRGESVTGLTTGLVAMSILLIIVSSVILVLMRQREYHDHKNLWRTEAFLSGICWLASPLIIHSQWNNFTNADEILVVGFFLQLLTWYRWKTTLLLSIFPIFLLDIHLSIDGHEVFYLKYLFILISFHWSGKNLYGNVEQELLEHAKTVRELEYANQIDQLTQIGNRRMFDERLPLSVKVANTTTSDLSLVLIDIDYFKQYNDTYGHPTGDICLKQIGKILKKSCKRTSDVVARIGGEEFAIILPYASKAVAKEIIHTVIEDLYDLNIKHSNSPLCDRVTISAGIAEYKDHETPASLYQRADERMYSSKQNGRNRITSD